MVLAVTVLVAVSITDTVPLRYHRDRRPYAVWRAARRRLVWLVLALATVTAVLTPLTVAASEWLYDRESHPSAILQTHAHRGDLMTYFSAAMLLVAIALAAMHWLEGRSARPRAVANVAVALLAVVGSVSSIVAVVRIGDSGAHAAWGSQPTDLSKP